MVGEGLADDRTGLPAIPVAIAAASAAVISATLIAL
jgi:hypothetical protein